jgi:hypothetical protein
MASGHIVRAHLDYDGNALLFRTATAERDPRLERALEESFPTGDLRRLVPVSESASGGYQVRMPLPLSVDEAREEMTLLRDGLVSLIGFFEPERLSAVERVTGTFGQRETLAHLHLRPPVTLAAALEDDAPARPADAPVDPPRAHDAKGADGGAFGSAAVH